jgi:multimeric flavodoxin WrbA
MVADNAQKLSLLCIAGSPRRGGNTDRLLNEAVVGAASKGAMVKHITLNDLEIAPCQHCDGCIQTGGICAIADDMQWLLADLREFDRFILASPVFFMGVTAQAKAMIDRCQALWVIKYIFKLPVGLKKDVARKGAFISVGGRSHDKMFEGSIATVKSWYHALDAEYAGEVLVKGIDHFNDIDKNHAALREAFALGQRIAS